MKSLILILLFSTNTWATINRFEKASFVPLKTDRITIKGMDLELKVYAKRGADSSKSENWRYRMEFGKLGPIAFKKIASLFNNDNKSPHDPNKDY